MTLEHRAQRLPRFTCPQCNKKRVLVATEPVTTDPEPAYMASCRSCNLRAPAAQQERLDRLLQLARRVTAHNQAGLYTTARRITRDWPDNAGRPPSIDHMKAACAKLAIDNERHAYSVHGRQGAHPAIVITGKNWTPGDPVWIRTPRDALHRVLERGPLAWRP